MKTFQISSDNTLAEVKENFNNLFPLLQVRFFNKAHEAGEGNASLDEIKDDSVLLKEVSGLSNEAIISVDGHKLVSTLESEFESLGIHAQIFRKSGNVWLQTTTTDHWSLAQQNREAQATLS